MGHIMHTIAVPFLSGSRPSINTPVLHYHILP